MDRDLFLKNAIKTIKKNNTSSFKTFDSFADDVKNKILSDKSYYKQLGSDLLRDFDYLNEEGYESTAWFAKKEYIEGDNIITKEIRKLMNESGQFFNLSKDCEIGTYLVTVKILTRQSGELISINRIIKLDGTVLDTFENYEYSCSFDSDKELKSFKYYFKDVKSESKINEMDLLIVDMMDSLGLKEKWNLDYFSLEDEKDYILLKKKYKHEGADLSLSVTKEKNKKQVLKFVSRDPDMNEEINAIFSNHDLVELNDASDMIDLNYRF